MAALHDLTRKVRRRGVRATSPRGLTMQVPRALPGGSTDVLRLVPGFAIGRLRLIALLGFMACACAGRSPKAALGAQPSWRQPPAARHAVFAPERGGAELYNGPLPQRSQSPLSTAVFEETSNAAATLGLGEPTADPRLDLACEELANVVEEDGSLSYAAVEFAMQRHGIIEPSPHLLVVWTDRDEPRAIVEHLRTRIPEILRSGSHSRVGIGQARRGPSGETAVVFALQSSNLTTSPMPRALPRGGVVRVEGKVAAGFRDPEVFVTRPDGQAVAVPHSGARTDFTTVVECGQTQGKLQIEITASDATGSTVLANFPVWCGENAPRTLALVHDDQVVTDPRQAEAQLLDLINMARRAHQLPALALERRVAAVALGYAEEMARTKVVAHISPATGSAADRARAAAIKTGVVLENVARAYGVREAHEGLMNSPGHRANILSPLATHVGIGVVMSDARTPRAEMFVTQMFIRVPPKLDSEAARRIVMQKLTSQRALKETAELNAAAAQMALALRQGATHEQAWAQVKQQLAGVRGQYRRIGAAVSTVVDVTRLDGASLLGVYQPHEIGLGLAQGPHPEIGEGAVWVVLLMAEK